MAEVLYWQLSALALAVAALGKAEVRIPVAFEQFG